jgi:hypothetical protein
MLVEQFLPSEVTPETLAAVAGVLLTLAFSYIPGLKDRFKNIGVQPDGQDDGNKKRLVMLGLLVVTTAGALAMICVPVIRNFFVNAGVAVAECSEATIFNYLKALVYAIVANQGVYEISYRTAKRQPLRAMKAPEDKG